MLRRVLRKVYRKLRPSQKSKPSMDSFSHSPPPRKPKNEESHEAEIQEVTEEEVVEEIDVEVEASTVVAWQEEGKNPILVDIRQPYELRTGYIQGSVLIPMNQLASEVEIFPKDVPIVLYCAAGARSFGMAHFMREKGFDQAWSMIGGVGEWSKHCIHPQQAKYELFQDVQHKEERMIVWGAEYRKDVVYYRLQRPGTLHLEKDVEESEITP